MVLEAKTALRPRIQRAEVSDDIVAKLGLGFWVGLLSTAYHDRLWIPTLHTLFPGAPVHPCTASSTQYGDSATG